MNDDVLLNQLRVLLETEGLPADEVTLEAIRPDLATLRSGLVDLRRLSLGDVEPAYEFRLDPEGW